MSQRLLVVHRFSGPSFDAHELEVDAAHELGEYKELLLATAAELWRSARPDRQRLPKGFRTGFRLTFTEVRSGSVEVPLYRPPRDYAFDGPDEYDQACELINGAIVAAVAGRAIPAAFPRAALSRFLRYGSSLAADESIELTIPGDGEHGRAVYTPVVQRKLIELIPAAYVDEVDVVGELRGADIDGASFHVRLAAGTRLSGTFEPEQEAVVTEALRLHDDVRVRARGRAAHDAATGMPIRFDGPCVLEIADDRSAAGARSVFDIVDQILADGTDDDLSGLPSDFSTTYKTHLYGAQLDDGGAS